MRTLLGTTAPSGTASGMPGLSEWIETLTLRAGYNTNLVILGTALLGFAAGVVGRPADSPGIETLVICRHDH